MKESCSVGSLHDHESEACNEALAIRNSIATNNLFFWAKLIGWQLQTNLSLVMVDLE